MVPNVLLSEMTDPVPRFNSLAEIERGLMSTDPAVRNAAVEAHRAYMMQGGAHTLPGMVTSAGAPTAHMLPAVVSSAPAPPKAHTLPTMTTTAPFTPRAHVLAAMQAFSPPPQSSAPSAFEVSNPSAMLAAMQPTSTPRAPSAISGLLSALTAPPPPPNAGPAPAGGLPMSQPNVSGAQGGPMLTPSAMPQMAGPQASPMPQQQVAPQPSMFDRIKERLGEMAGNIGAPRDPTEYSGLLSADEIQRAKPGLLSRLASITPGAPTPGQQYQSTLDHMVAMKQMTAGISEQRRILQARHEMGNLFPVAPNATRDQQAAMMAQQYNYALSHGDLEMVKDIGQNMRALMAAPKPDTMHTLTPGSVLLDDKGKQIFANPSGPKAPVIGSPEWKAAEEYKAKLAAQYRVEPQQILQGTDENGDSHFYRVPKNGGPPEMISGMAPKSGTGRGAALSGQTMQTLGRLGMSFNDLKQAIDQMDQFENDPKNLQKMTPARRAIAATSETMPNPEAHGLMGGLNNAAGALLGGIAQQKLSQDDPQFNTYLNNKQRVATAFTELLPRPNQQLLQLEKGLSGADVNWNPTLMGNIQSRRRGGLDVLKNILQQQGMLDESGNMTGMKRGAKPSGANGNIDLRDKSKPASAPTASKRTITTDQRDFLRTVKHMTDAEIAQSYTVKP